jgi:hypothetical protein
MSSSPQEPRAPERAEANPRAAPAAESDRGWVHAGLGEAKALDALAALSGSELSSFLLELANRRSTSRTPADTLHQFERDAFTAVAAVDARKLLRTELRLLDAAAAFEAVELSPLAPFGACVAVAPGSQNRIVTTTRGTEVASDATNILALECARRLRREPARTVRLATCQRVVRAQPIPKLPGYAQHFKLFALATAGLETKDHGFVVGVLLEHIRALLAGLKALTTDGYALPPPRVKILATPARASLADQIADALRAQVSVERDVLEHPYYHGLRFMLDCIADDGSVVGIADGGAFDWVGKLTSNRRHTFVASGLGIQRVVDFTS